LGTIAVSSSEYSSASTPAPGVIVTERTVNAVPAALRTDTRSRCREKSGTVAPCVLSGIAYVPLFCTVAGYYAVLPMMEAARAGQASVSFATLHIVSTGFFTLKGLLVLALAWRLTRPPASS
jgi:hypothetical protein